MNQKEIRELIEFLVEKDIAEFELERGDMKLHVRRGSASQPAPVVVAPALTAMPSIPVLAAPATAPSPTTAPSSGDGAGTGAATQPPATRVEADAGLFVVKSPIVGTFYEAPSPGTPPFVQVGDTVREGQVLCIIEAMKLMNEIEADVAGEIVKKLVANGQPIEYGQELFVIRPRI